MKANKKELLLTSAVCLLPLLAGTILYPRLPETMATHWGFDGTADGWAPRGMAVFGLPLLILALQSHDPSQRSQGFLTLAGGIIITFAREILDLIIGTGA